MTDAIPHSIALKRHPQTPSQAVRGLIAQVCSVQGRALAIRFVLEAELDWVRIPPPRPPRRADRLWEHTCFEAFLALPGKPSYYEFNFAPSGEWAAYAFERYREGAPLTQAVDPVIRMLSTGERLELEALVSLDQLMLDVKVRLALCAVIEESSGTLSYWALNHPSGRPDFHHPDGFALELER